MAAVHLAVLRWVRPHDGLGWDDERPNPGAFAKLLEIAEKSKSPIPLLYDLQFELRELAKQGEFPPMAQGYRAFDLCPLTRPVKDSVVLQVPLLELPPDIEPGGPTIPRPFMGWLKIEKVAVPRRDDDTPLWSTSHVYPAPVFAILDQDKACREAIQTAVQFVNSRSRVTTSAGPWPGRTVLRCLPSSSGITWERRSPWLWAWSCSFHFARVFTRCISTG
jgi:hypothetical protein